MQKLPTLSPQGTKEIFHRQAAKFVRIKNSQFLSLSFAPSRLRVRNFFNSKQNKTQRLSRAKTPSRKGQKERGLKKWLWHPVAVFHTRVPPPFLPKAPKRVLTAKGRKGKNKKSRAVEKMEMNVTTANFSYLRDLVGLAVQIS